MVDQRTLPNDQFGYSVYTLVAHASQKQIEAIDGVRRAIGLTRATIPAHVTVRGTFHSIDNLTGIRVALREAALRRAPVSVIFGPEGWKYFTGDGDRNTAIMLCETTQDLLDLREWFDAIIRPISTNAYRDEYLAHMTLCQDCTTAQIQKAKELAVNLDIGRGFEISSVELMGRVGPAFGGEWKLIESFPLQTT